MADQIPMSADQLCDLIVKDIRRRAGCQGFKSVTVYELAEGQIEGVNWGTSNANYGDADPGICNAELQEIIPRVQRQYRLKG